MSVFSLPVAEVKDYRIFRKVFLCSMISLWFLTIVTYYEHLEIRKIVLPISMLITCLWMSADELLMYRNDYINVRGSIKLTNSEIVIVMDSVPRTFKYAEITRIILNVEETSRDKAFRSSFNKRKSGLGNSIEIVESNQDSWTYPLYIDSSLEIEQLDHFLKSVQTKKIVIKRNGEKVESIKETHYKWYPKEHWDTSPKKK